MPKNQKPKNYKHQTTGEPCTCAAWIAEWLCMKNAEFKNKGSLPYKFWRVKPWDWTFKRQLFEANKILKIYPEAVVVRAIVSPEFSRIFSLNNKQAIKIIDKYSRLSAVEATIEKKTLAVVENASTRSRTYGQKSLLQKLREKENGKKESTNSQE